MLVNRSGLLKDNEQSYRDKAINYPNETNGKQTSQNKRSEGGKDEEPARLKQCSIVLKQIIRRTCQ